MTIGARPIPSLNRALLATPHRIGSGTKLPDPATLQLPEKVVQFGTGAFLRGFVDFFLDEAIARGAYAGRVVAIGSTGSGRDGALNAQDGLYTIIVEGASQKGNGSERECRVIASVSRALDAAREWTEVLALARRPRIELVFSNTTEIGIGLDPGDLLDAAPPASFPGKLAHFLLERGRHFDYADSAGPIVIPCELIERNGDRLRELVLELARRWDVESAFTEWIGRAVPFCNTLVDRIVPGMPNESRRMALEEELGYRDGLMIAAEPYTLFAIEADGSTRARLKWTAVNDGIVLTDDVRPFRERKVRILNGGHTVMAPIGLLVGCHTVLDAMNHPLVSSYLGQLLFEEIVPSVDVPEAERFAEDVLLRFANPYLRHALRDITVQQTAKMRVRVVPSILAFAERTGSVPPRLSFGFAAYLAAIRAASRADHESPISLGIDAEGERIRSLWLGARDEDTSLKGVVQAVCRDTELWHADLSRVPGFPGRVAEDLRQIVSGGTLVALASHAAGNTAHATPAPALSSKT